MDEMPNALVALEGQRQQLGNLLIGFRAVSGVLDLAGQLREGVDQAPESESGASLGDALDCLLGQRTGEPVLGEEFRRVLRGVRHGRLHGGLDRADESILAAVALLNQLGNQSADLREGITDVAGVLPFELHDFNRIPHDVVLADTLEPECLNADRPLANFAIPDEEAWCELLVANLGPAGRVNQEAEQILLSAVESGGSTHAGGRRLELGGRVGDHFQQVRIPQPAVGHAMQGADDRPIRQQLQRLVATWQRLAEGLSGRLGRKPVHRVAADATERTELGE